MVNCIMNILLLLQRGRQPHQLLIFAGLLASFLLLPLCSVVKQLSQLEVSILSQERMEFSYDESSPFGPQHWGDLRLEWCSCKHGQEQSPVDINNVNVGVPELGSPTLCLNVNYHTNPATLQNSGHGIMVNWTNGAGHFMICGETYVLRQSHWHLPAEHTIYGLRYPLEMHTVYMTSTGKIVVIGVLYKLGYQDDLFISKLVEPLKQLIETQEEEIYLGNVAPDEIDRRSSYFRYHGSLTTPPCTEGVIWTIMEEVKTVSPDHLKLLSEAVHNMSNARPVQPINGRTIKVFRQEQSSASSI